MPYTIYAECPCCNKPAKSKQEIDALFGWRIVNGKEIPQSYCYDCRNAGCKKGEPCKAKK